MKTAVLTKGDGAVVSDRCHIADAPLGRMRGLLGRSGLEPGESMLFRPAGSIHMFFMRFAIDVVFCDDELAVLEVIPGLQPWRTAAHRGAKVVIELGEGSAAGLAPGDRLSIATIDS
jgi:uncharacterized membrane protein (UPF0127 family)